MDLEYLTMRRKFNNKFENTKIFTSKIPYFIICKTIFALAYASFV